MVEILNQHPSYSSSGETGDSDEKHPNQFVEALLHEIFAHLKQLAEHGTETAIDLHAMPMSEEDRNALQKQLGQGEVKAQLEVAGESEIWETSFPGVWWIAHKGLDDKIASETIAITPIPEILKSNLLDIKQFVQQYPHTNS